MYCTNCGHRNPEGANFCSTCGSPLIGGAPEDTTISFMVDSEVEAEEEFSVPLEELEEGKAILVVRRGPDAGTKFFLDKDVVTCGRSPASDIFLDDVTVSRRHAEFLHTDAGIVVKDLGSLNGTYVNGERAEERPIGTGDEVQVGRFKLLFLGEGGGAAVTGT